MTSPAEALGLRAKRDVDSLSQDGDEPSAAAEQGSAKTKKKRTAAAGPRGRGVASLTPEQLAKKRANDREAQRAIRERTKNQIETLERRVAELTGLGPYRELQAAVHAKEAIERENADIKRQLAAVVDILRPIIGTAGAEALASHTSPGQSLGTPAATYVTPMTTTSSNSSARDAEHSQRSHPWPRDEQPSGQSDHLMAQLQQQRQQLRRGLDAGLERLELAFLLRPGQRVNRVQDGPHGAQDTPQYHHVPMKHDWTGATNNETLRARPVASSSQVRLDGLGIGPRSASSPVGISPEGPGSSPPAVTAAAWVPGQVPRHAMPVLNCRPTCPLDALLLDFLAERRQRAAESLPMQEVTGPRYPSVSSLLSPANSVYSHPLSKLFTDILATFPDISALPERVAVLYIMFLFMRWQIAPTRENYDRLPPWMQPCSAQLEHPHPAWIDFLPFPLMREKLARTYNPDEYLFGSFFIPFTTTLRLGWPYEETDTVLLVPDSDEIVINPVFERHLRNLHNWTLGDRFCRAFPALADTWRVRSAS
ncbi:hypothetical protein HIM_02936 [Hirsutella minnesotensis 3608]|nr:hypothetical protein HIM_02936 [Hirsutella minnesotensis 3608]